MPKKIITLVFLILFVVSSIFAERKTRLDTYGNAKVKIIWNTNYLTAPDNANYAKGFKKEWASVLEYFYFINPKNTTDNTSIAVITLFSGDETVYPYKHLVTVYICKDDVNELAYEQKYLSSEYNLAKTDFNYWTNYYEQFVSF